MSHAHPDPRVAVDYDPRTRILFGAGTLDVLGGEAAAIGRRTLIVTDAGLAATGHLARAKASLAEAGCEVDVFDGVRPNPTTEDVEACRAFAAGSFGGRGPDLLVGLGGGSSMDCAKGALFLLAGGGTMSDYRGTGLGRGTFLPLITIPTTAGTGSEAQSYAVISDAQTHLKMACGDKRAAARLAILDPDLTATMPPMVRAVTGIDAVSHAVETLVSTARTPLSQMFSRQSWRLLSQALPRVLADPADDAARGDMLFGAYLAGSAIEASMLGAAHAMANPLTAQYEMTHGVAIAAVLPTVVEFNAEDDFADELYGQMATAAGREGETGGGRGGRRLAALLRELVAAAGLPADLREAGASEGDVAAMAEAAAQQWTGRFNPRPMTADLFAGLYRRAIGAAAGV